VLSSNFIEAIKTLIMAPNPEHNDSTNSSKYICPLTMVPFNGINSFVAIWTTGYVITEKAIRELGIGSLQSEYGPFSESDIIHLLPSDVELSQRKARWQAEQEVAQRKSKKKKRQESLGETESDTLTHTLDTQVDSHSQKKLCAVANSLSTQQVVDIAQSKNQSQEERSQVFQNLFHKDSDTKTSQRDLFISVGGLRYTLS
jgi:hypothetical protein